MGGVSSARNQGLNAACGKYYVFVDSDDRLKPYYLEKLFDAIDGTKSQLAVGGMIEYSILNKTEKCHKIKGINETKKEMNVAEAFPIMDKSGAAVQVWNKIYRYDLFEDDFRFDESIKFSEDAVLNYTLFLNKVQHVSLVDECGYVYVKGYLDDIMSRYFADFPKWQRMDNQLYFAIKHKIGYVDSEFDAFLRHRYTWMVTFNLYHRGCPLSIKEKAEVIKREIFSNEQVMKDYYEGLPFAKVPTREIRAFHLVMQTNSPYIVAMVMQVVFAFSKFIHKLRLAL